jgi:nitrite reductase/ring-hydroxylating ferredoxin subunit
MGEFTVTGLEELGDRGLAAYDVSGKRIAIAKVGDAFYAFGDTCTHLGCSLSEGQLEASGRGLRRRRCSPRRSESDRGAGNCDAHAPRGTIGRCEKFSREPGKNNSTMRGSTSQ